MNPIKKLLDNLDLISNEFKEINDTDVREQLSELLEGILIKQDGYEIPKEVGMFSDLANDKVIKAMIEFRNDIAVIGLKKFKDRREARKFIQQNGVESNSGNLYDEYFGHMDMCEISKKTSWWKLW